MAEESGSHLEHLQVGLMQPLVGARRAPRTGGLVVRQDDAVWGRRASLALHVTEAPGGNRDLVMQHSKKVGSYI